MRPRLKLYTGELQTTATPEPPPIKIRLGEVTRILRDAVGHDRTWLSDFDDEEVLVSADLYEVLCAYSQLRPTA
jgi:hypothetical protein